MASRNALLQRRFLAYYFRYMYWENGNCRTRARLQVSLNGSTWYDDYDLDVNILHLTGRPASTMYTQTLANAGDWYYKTAGTASTCGTGFAHSHLAMQLSSYVVPNFGVSSSVDTCWANGTECLVMPALNPKKHTGACPPQYTWLGAYASTGSPDYKRSGTVVQPYECQTWSEGVAWGSDTPVFRGSKAY